MSAGQSGDGPRSRLEQAFSAPLAIYGLMIYTVLVGVVADHSHSNGETFVGTALAQVVFFAAHVFAFTLGGHGVHGFRAAVRRAVEHSSALLYGAIPPAVVLAVGTVAHAEPEVLIGAALLVSTLVLGLLGFAAYYRRTRKWAVSIAGGLGTALLGIAVMVIEYWVH